MKYGNFVRVEHPLDGVALVTVTVESPHPASPGHLDLMRRLTEVIEDHLAALYATKDRANA